MNPSRLTVVIPTHNRLLQLQDSLSSVAKSGAAEVSVLVVADTCDDGTVAWLEQNQVPYTAVSAGSPARARNAGLRLVQTEFVAFLDDDDVWVAGHPSAALQAFSDDPSLSFVWSRVRLADSELRPFGSPLPGVGSRPKPRDFWRHAIQIGAVVFRTSSLREVGGFPAELRFFEDQPVMVRMAARHRGVELPHVGVLFRQRPKSVGDALVRPTARRDYRAAEALVRSVSGGTLRDRVLTAWRHRGRWMWNYLDDAAFLLGRGMAVSAATACVRSAIEAPDRFARAVVVGFPELRRAYADGRRDRVGQREP